MHKSTLLIAVLLSGFITNALADEGMWLPFKLKENTIGQMQEKGFKLEAEDIYSPDRPSFNDAVVGLGREGRPFSHFCTGGLISDKGLFVTNHHCGYGYIQRHSTLQNDYLTDGFWAYSLNEELTNTGLTASILRRMEDVTQLVFEGINVKHSNKERDSVMRSNMLSIEQKAIEGTHYFARVSPFYNGNEYYLSVYEIFNDVRLVGAPPSAIGKFGGDTDNWVWPRHTGDFSLFRIYAGPDNKPAPYSSENKPYVPDKYFEINGNGVKEGDFTFVMGYPGTTQQYLPSAAIAFQKNIENPIRIKLREIRIETMKDFMEQDRAVRIQYSSKVAGLANAWKKWIGEIQGLDRFEVVEQKKMLESRFFDFSKENAEYKDVLNQYDEIYAQLSKITPYREYYNEGAYQIELIRFVHSLRELGNKSNSEINKKEYVTVVRDFYKDYFLPIDKALFSKLMVQFEANVPVEYQPDYYKKIRKQFKGDLEKLGAWFFEKSVFADSAKLIKAINDFGAKNQKIIISDPAYLLYTGLQEIYENLLNPQFRVLERKLPALNKLYLEGLRKMQTEKTFYPDANSTFRIGYGQVYGYSPIDAVHYDWHTTLAGIMEKDNPDIYDYDVPKKLKELYKDKDFGPYTDAANKVAVCFAATNHTTGGNSGSPILDANGRIVGINFDRAWDGVMSDLYYNPQICRNISLDIRYIMFIVDKYAGAQNIIKELSIVR
jgi:hypothetical protein